MEGALVHIHTTVSHEQLTNSFWDLRQLTVAMHILTISVTYSTFCSMLITSHYSHMQRFYKHEAVPKSSRECSCQQCHRYHFVYVTWCYINHILYHTLRCCSVQTYTICYAVILNMQFKSTSNLYHRQWGWGGSTMGIRCPYSLLQLKNQNKNYSSV